MTQSRVVGLDDYFSDRDGLTLLRAGCSYRRRPAQLVNPEVASAAVRRRYARADLITTPPEGVARFDSAVVFGPGVIQLADGRILAESLYRLAADPWAEREPDGVERTFASAVHVGGRGNDNYGHFLVEQLPRLVINAPAYPEDAPILLGEGSRPFALPMLELAGLDTGRVVWQSEAARAETLYWPTRTTWHRLVNSPHVFEFLRSLAGRAAPGAAADRLLFVGRRDARTRRLLNDDDVFDRLAPFGFERVDAGHLSFEEQVRAFAGARVVVAVGGAALTNMVFMPPGGSVVMVGPPTSAGYFFWDLAHHLDLSLTVLWGEAENPSANTKNIDFRVDADTLARVVEREV